MFLYNQEKSFLITKWDVYQLHSTKCLHPNSSQKACINKQFNPSSREPEMSEAIAQPILPQPTILKSIFGLRFSRHRWSHPWRGFEDNDIAVVHDDQHTVSVDDDDVDDRRRKESVGRERSRWHRDVLSGQIKRWELEDPGSIPKAKKVLIQKFCFSFFLCFSVTLSFLIFDPSQPLLSGVSFF